MKTTIKYITAIIIIINAIFVQHANALLDNTTTNSDTIRIRPVNKNTDEKDVLTILHTHCFNLTGKEDCSEYDKLEKYIESHELDVLEKNGQVIGFVKLKQYYTMGVFSPAIKKEEQGKGYGAKLINHAIQHFEKNGTEEITLTVDSFNTQALLAYNKAGFKQTYYPMYDDRYVNYYSNTLDYKKNYVKQWISLTKKLSKKPKNNIPYDMQKSWLLRWFRE